MQKKFVVPKVSYRFREANTRFLINWFLINEKSVKKVFSFSRSLLYKTNIMCFFKFRSNLYSRSIHVKKYGDEEAGGREF